MGCDVHVMIEYSELQNSDGSLRWSGMGGIWNPGRDYAMFEILAGVRGDDDKAIFPPRGLPSDMSYLGKENFEDEELHSLTWLTWDEFAAAVARRMFECDWPYAIGWDVLLTTMSAFREHDIPTRLLVAFDN